MKLSILTVVTDRDRGYNELLVNSIKETISLQDKNYEIIVHDNNHTRLQLSYAHATGLTEGYKKTKGEIVLILDSDTYFFAKNWDEELIQCFDLDGDVAFCAGMRCDTYQTPFYRSHFLAIRSSFYKDLIINEKGFFPEAVNGVMINDMSCKINQFCIENGKKYIHYRNSLNDNLPAFYGNSGETVYNSKDEPFFHHIGRGSSKPERFKNWREFWNKQIK